MLSDKKEEQAVMKEMVEEVAKNVASADIEKAVEQAKQDAEKAHAEIPKQQQSPPVIGQIVITKYLMNNQTPVDVQKGGIWTVADLLDLSEKLTTAARQQVIGQVDTQTLMPSVSKP